MINIDPQTKTQIQDYVAQGELKHLHALVGQWTPQELADLLEELPVGQDAVVFRLLPRKLATETFEYLAAEKQQELIEGLAHEQERLVSLLNDLSPDDRTALFEELPGPVTQRLLNLLSPKERAVAVALLGYPEYSIGRLMTPDYVAIRPEWSVREVLEHIRRHGKDSETLNVIYVVDDQWHLLDDLRIREVLLAEPETRITSLIDNRFVALKASDDQETAIRVFREQARTALPVTDNQGILLGIVTIDDVLDVAEEEATEDIHKVGGLEALSMPYMMTSFGALMQKRARWLIVLFVGEMLTATAMGFYEHEIARAVVLALFVPLIISSGGNSGSQAASLIIRALAVGEVGVKDWWHVMHREIFFGLSLGLILGTIGFVRVALWEQLFGIYGEHWALIALTIGCSLVGVVLWGTLSGSMLPFIMQRLGVDPATSSAPFVATLVDVTGLVIYFSVAAFVLRGTLL
jgi:magnesium transporter